VSRFIPFSSVLLSGILILSSLPSLHGQDFERMRQEVADLGQLTSAPKVFPADGFPSEPHLQAIFYQGLPWQEKPTRVFAWLGFPSESTTEKKLPLKNGKYPAIVLVHGGGGTAFKEWVKRWNERGYVAISIAVEGQTDERREGNSRGWKTHAWNGPQRIGIYQDSNEPLQDQWMYHAVADTILAHSLLASLPQVDSERIGLMGISWGGVITSTVVGIDTRFAFAIPTYGCGGLENADNQWGRALGNNPVYQQVLDPMVRLPQATLPMLWLSWTGDTHFPMDCLARSYRAAPGPRQVTLVPNMRHSHQAGWVRPESYAFADSVVNSGEGWMTQKSLERVDRKWKATFVSNQPIDEVALYTTTEQGEGPDRNWTTTQVSWSQQGQQVVSEGMLPPGTQAWFISLKSNDLYASSDYQTTQP
jgi:dienelactone hydrolase